MGTCGSKIPRPDPSISSLTRPPLRSSGPGSLTPLWLVVLCMVASLLAGCMTLQYGWQPPVERLQSLNPGVSTPADVLMALGEPRGRGMVRYIPEAAPRNIWFYEYVETDGRAVNIKFLLVFFEKERYEGNFWFFSGMDTETKWFQ